MNIKKGINGGKVENILPSSSTMSSLSSSKKAMSPKKAASSSSGTSNKAMIPDSSPKSPKSPKSAKSPKSPKSPKPAKPAKSASLGRLVRSAKSPKPASLGRLVRSASFPIPKKMPIDKLSASNIENMFGKLYLEAYLEVYIDISDKEIKILNENKNKKFGFNEKEIGGSLAKIKGGVPPFGLVRNLTSANSADRDMNTYTDYNTRNFFENLWVFFTKQNFQRDGNQNIDINITPVGNVSIVLRRRNTDGYGELNGYRTYTYSIIINISNLLHWTLFHEIDREGGRAWRVDRLHMTMSQWQDGDNYHHGAFRIYFPYTETIIQVIRDHGQLGSMYVLARLMLGGAYNILSRGRSFSDNSVRTELFRDITTELINAGREYRTEQISEIANIHKNFIIAVNFPPQVLSSLNPMQIELEKLIRHVASLGY